jgi:hypothetical protein
MAKEFDLVSSWNSYITNSSILRVRIGRCRHATAAAIVAAAVLYAEAVL